MMNDHKVEWLSIISLVVTSLLALFKNDINQNVIFVLIGALVIIVIAYFIYSKTKSNKNLSNTAVINKTKKYTKYLYSLVKANMRQMKKEVNVSDLVLLQKKNKKIINHFEGKEKSQKQTAIDLSAQKQELVANFVKKNNKYVTNEMLKVNQPYNKVVKKTNQEQTIEVYNTIYDTIHQLERILLQLEQHALRIKLGKYVIRCSNNISQIINAYVDLIGWTHILLGDNKKGFSSIQCGIDLIDYKLSALEKGSKEYCEYTLQKARALRHLGTTYYTYKSKKDKFVKECLLEAKDLISQPDIVQYYESTPKLKETYGKMMFGLKYNELLYDYYVALENKDEFSEKINKISEGILKLREEVNQSDFSDNHRLVKVITLQNQIEKNRILQTKTTKDDHSAIWKNKLHNDLIQIEEVLNKNIYFDEAMEVYVCQKIDELYSNVEAIFLE